MKEKKIFWIHFKIDKSIGVNLKEIVKVLDNFNKLFLRIAEYKNLIDDKNFKRETFEPIIINKIREGCMAVGVKLQVSGYNTTFLGDPYDKNTNLVKESLKSTEKQEDLQFFEKEFPDNQKRVNILNILKNLNPWKDKEHYITYNGIEEDFEKSEIKIYLNKDKRILINKWIRAEKIVSLPFKVGLFNGFKASSDVFWIIEQQKGIEINCEIPEDEFEGLDLKYGYIYKVSGDYQEVPGSKPSITNIVNIDKITSVSILEEMKKLYSKKIEEILNLDMNWDGYGSKRFKEETIINALLFISKLNSEFLTYSSKKLPKPMLFPGANGALNLEWSDDKFDLLITIPEDTDDLAGLYGIDKGKNEVKYDFMVFDLEEGLLEWLNKNL